MAARVRPPRVALTRFLQGRMVGPPNRPEAQKTVLRQALDFLTEATPENWLLRLPLSWSQALNLDKDA